MIANRQNTGALRREAKRPLRERLYWLPRVFSLVLLVVALMGAGWGLEKLYERLNVAIGVIAIKGEFAQVDQAAEQGNPEAKNISEKLGNVYKTAMKLSMKKNMG